MPSKNKRARIDAGRVKAWLVRLIRLGLSLILISPLLAWSGFLFPHITAKVLSFQILLEIVLAAALFLVAIDEALRRHLLRVASSPLFLALGLLMGYTLAGSMLGVDPLRSLWGLIDRQDGLVLLFHFFSWMLVVTWFYSVPPVTGRVDRPEASPEFSHGPGLHGYLGFSYWISAAVALTAVAQHPQIQSLEIFQYLGSVVALGTAERVSGVFGNPIALGPYLSFHFFYGMYQLGSIASKPGTGHGVQSRDREIAVRSGALGAELRGFLSGPAGRGLWIGRFGLVLLAQLLIGGTLYAGQTRGVVFGILAGLLAAALILILRKPTPRLVRVLGIFLIAGIVMASASIWYLRDTDFVRSSPALSRFANVAQDESGSMKQRWLVWGSALQAVKDHPLLGWGYNNIYYALNDYYDPRLVQFTPDFQDSRSTWYDKAHNFFLDMAVERGILGLALYVYVLVLAARFLWEMENRVLAATLAGSLVAYLIGNGVAFETFGSMFQFFLLFSAILAVGRPGGAQAGKPADKRSRGSQESPARARLPGGKNAWAAGLTVAFLLILGPAMNVEIALANRKYLQAQIAFERDPAAGIAAYQDAFGHYSPYHPRQKLNCAYLVVNSAITEKKASRSVEAGRLLFDLINDALRSHPQDAAYHMVVADIYNGLALYGDRSFAARAIASGRRALELSPHRQEVIFQLGRAHVLNNEPSRAIELNRRMVADYPDFPLAHWFLGLAFLADDNREAARGEIAEAIRLGYRFQNAAEQKTVADLFGEEAFQQLLQPK